MEKPKEKLISYTCGGLGNRIKSLVHCLSRTDDVKIYWPNHIDPYNISGDEAKIENFNDLFCSNLELIYDADIDKALNSGYIISHSPIWDNAFGYSYFTDMDKMKFFYDIIKKHLKPSSKVINIYESRFKMVSDCEVGVFIRTGDTVVQSFQHNYNKIEDVDTMLDKNIKTFISGDSPLIYEYFKNHDNVVCFLDDDYVYGGWIYGFANLLLLAGCQKIVLPSSSTYAEVVMMYNFYRSQRIEIPICNSRAYPTRSKSEIEEHVRRLKSKL